jgi:hypothetical protein
MIAANLMWVVDATFPFTPAGASSRGAEEHWHGGVRPAVDPGNIIKTTGATRRKPRSAEPRETG